MEIERPQEFPCPQCPFKTVTRSYLPKHIAGIHEGIKQFKCDVCDYATAFRQCLFSHIRIQHVGHAAFQCSQCSYRTPYKKCLDGHVKNVHEQIRLKCDFCDFATKDEDQLARHRLQHEGGKVLACKQCPYRTAYRNRLAFHVSSVHGTLRRLRCERCSYSTPYTGSLDKHTMNKHGAAVVKAFQCSECSFSSERKHLLANHIESVHNQEALVKRKMKRRQRKEHHVVPSSERDSVSSIDHRSEDLSLMRFACPLCSFGTDEERALSHHIQSVHGLGKKRSYASTFEGPMKCSECGYTTGSCRHVHETSSSQQTHQGQGDLSIKCGIFCRRSRLVGEAPASEITIISTSS